VQGAAAERERNCNRAAQRASNSVDAKTSGISNAIGEDFRTNSINRFNPNPKTNRANEDFKQPRDNVKLSIAATERGDEIAARGRIVPDDSRQQASPRRRMNDELDL